VDRFNNDPEIPLFLLSLKAGGTGLNLTSADTVIIYDPWWNPAVELQAADRTHRIGQTRTVSTVKLVMKDSVEEKVLMLQQKKRELFQSLVENPAAGGGISLAELRALIE
jgi:non-specific serine/threonine protein kinase